MMTLLSVVRRFPLLAYFALAYALSGVALAVIGWPRLDGAAPRPTTALLMFPVIVIGVGMVGLALTAATAGRAGLGELRSRLVRWRLGWWSLVLLLPPLGILAVLTALRVFVSPRFAPGFLAFGISAGILAGFLEEFGWTGFAYPRLGARFGALGGALLLGVLWGLWHLPVVDALGAASPHGSSWPAFFASFVALLVALRVLIAWLYTHTGSILGAQLLHASSTGFLVVLGAPQVSPAQEALWYLAYALLLWLVVGLVVALYGPSLTGARRGSARRRGAGEALAAREGGTR
jgi:membrane protease YdiL (CAAX protease family)